MSTESRLDEVYGNAERILIDENSKIVCMSDCHRGVGDHIDNFLPNQNLFFAALDFYNKKRFTYMELGDGDELWENRKLKRIVEIHSDSFWMISQFHKENRFRMLFGNHDCKKKKRKYMKANCESYYCDSEDKHCSLLPLLCAKEGILLVDKESRRQILLVHGHQGDLLNDTLWPLASFLVRYIWRFLEMLGVYDPTSAARNYKKRKKTERRIDNWAKKNQVMVIAGHTHRPVLPKPGESLYLNDGSCVHPRCITAMEIENNAVTLVKWSVMVRHGRMLSVEREVLEGPIPLEKYWN
ncbi:metallophosphoesterase family protein [Lachnospiraceae bacterium OttesenSCG-928-D06]|nr:metallophosphoesterase family protein [Lachnospiraceae bacterium OttesenSCG-928-D06]